MESVIDFQLDPQFFPHTGDEAFDDFLIDINRIAGRRINDYIVDLSPSFNVPRKKIIFLIYNERMQPADVFMILQISRLSGQAQRKIVKKFKQHRRKGWGAVVLSLGIKPGSKMFLLLKKDIPQVIWNYVEYWPEWKKGSKKKKKGSKRRKGSKKKGSKRKKGSKGKK
ncbi:MAG: hypothetical protein D3923_18900 [Candidatus Electrothrix sp. AR3]|nr:hypothetical protein [Candidatus Electrothrix sp. AR3]